MLKRTLMLAVLGILLLTISTTPPAQAFGPAVAIVPAIAWPIWAAFTGATTTAAVKNEIKKDEANRQEERGASLQDRDGVGETTKVDSQVAHTGG
jgi:hypothetical protein